MSNVLIGIIGVILFIGLALAGAVVLGDDFRTASTNSKATAYVARMGQMIAAAQMFQLKTGESIGYGRTFRGVGFLSPRFLQPLAHDPDSEAPNIGMGDGGPFVYIFLRGSRAQEVCEEIQRATGQVGPSDPPLAGTNVERANARWNMGCVWHDGAYWAFWANI